MELKTKLFRVIIRLKDFMITFVVTALVVGYHKFLSQFLYLGRVAWWLATCARKPKVPEALCSNRPANVYVSVKRVKVVERS